MKQDYLDLIQGASSVKKIMRFRGVSLYQIESNNVNYSLRVAAGSININPDNNFGEITNAQDIAEIKAALT